MSLLELEYIVGLAHYLRTKKMTKLLTGNKLQVRLNELGHETDNTDWDSIGTEQDWEDFQQEQRDAQDYQRAEIEVEGKQK